MKIPTVIQTGILDNTILSRVLEAGAIECLFRSYSIKEYCKNLLIYM